MHKVHISRRGFLSVLSRDACFSKISAGCTDAWSRGPINGYGLIGVKVTVTEADLEQTVTNTVDALRFAMSDAVTMAVESADANAAMMEPIMSVEVAVSDAFVGVVLNDLTGKRRGIVQTVGGGGAEGATALGRQTVMAEVPLKEMVAYSTALRSLTQGGGDFTMALARYDFALEM
jgi:elongation factor G